MLGVPEELGGAVEERSAVTSSPDHRGARRAATWASHSRRSLPPRSAPRSASGATPTSRRTYLPAFTGDDVPAAALAIQEPRALFDPFELATKARREGDGFVLDGLKSLVPRAADAELFVIAADLEGSGPGAVHRRGGASEGC